MVGEYLKYGKYVVPKMGFYMNSRKRSILDTLIRSTVNAMLEIEVLPGRRIRFAGKILKGVRLPKTLSAQKSMMDTIVATYGPCLEVQTGGNYLNEDCFNKKEQDFLIFLTKKLSNLKFKYIL